MDKNQRNGFRMNKEMKTIMSLALATAIAIPNVSFVKRPEYVRAAEVVSDNNTLSDSIVSEEAVTSAVPRLTPPPRATDTSIPTPVPVGAELPNVEPADYLVTGQSVEVIAANGAIQTEGIYFFTDDNAANSKGIQFEWPYSGRTDLRETVSEAGVTSEDIAEIPKEYLEQSSLQTILNETGTIDYEYPRPAWSKGVSVSFWSKQKWEQENQSNSCPLLVIKRSYFCDRCYETGYDPGYGGPIKHHGSREDCDFGLVVFANGTVSFMAGDEAKNSFLAGNYIADIDNEWTYYTVTIANDWITVYANGQEIAYQSINLDKDAACETFNDGFMTRYNPASLVTQEMLDKDIRKYLTAPTKWDTNKNSAYYSDGNGGYTTNWEATIVGNGRYREYPDVSGYMLLMDLLTEDNVQMYLGGLPSTEVCCINSSRTGYADYKTPSGSQIADVQTYESELTAAEVAKIYECADKPKDIELPQSSENPVSSTAPDMSEEPVTSKVPQVNVSPLPEKSPVPEYSLTPWSSDKPEALENIPEPIKYLDFEDKNIVGVEKDADRGSVFHYTSDETELVFDNPYGDESLAKSLQERSEFDVPDSTWTKYNGTRYQPVWNKGVTFSYWIKVPSDENGYYKNSSALRWELLDQEYYQAADYAIYLACQYFDKEKEVMGYTEEDYAKAKLEESKVIYGSQYFFRYLELSGVDEDGAPKARMYTGSAGFAGPVYDSRYFDGSDGIIQSVYYMYNPNFVRGYTKLADGSYEAQMAELAGGGINYYEHYSTLDMEKGSYVRRADVDGELQIDVDNSIFWVADNHNGINKNYNLKSSYGTKAGMQNGDCFFMNSWKGSSENNESGNGTYQSAASVALSPVSSGSHGKNGNCDTWHQVTVTLQNDWVEFYVDGIKADVKNNYSTRGLSTIDTGEAFKRLNKGTGLRYGYGSEKGAINFSYGNYVCRLLMDWITDEEATLHIGGSGQYAEQYNQAATSTEFYMDDLTFYGELLTEEQIKYLYESVENEDVGGVTTSPKPDEKPDTEASATPKPSEAASPTPKPSEAASATPKPSEEVSPTPEPSKKPESEEPTTDKETTTEEIKNEDGTVTNKVTEKETSSDGTVSEKVTETTVGTDGSKTEKIQETVTKPDGSTVTTTKETITKPGGVVESEEKVVTQDDVGLLVSLINKLIEIAENIYERLTTIEKQQADGSLVVKAVTETSNVDKAGNIVTGCSVVDEKSVSGVSVEKYEYDFKALPTDVEWKTQKFDKPDVDDETILKSNGAVDYAVYDIVPQSDGKKIDIKDGKVKVSLHCGDKWKGKKIKVFDFKKNQWLEAEADGQYVSFYAEHFSKYAIAEVTNVKPGDVDQDGEITLQDAQLTLKAALKIEELTNEQVQAADVDGTIGVALSDAQMILKAALKIIEL